MDDFTNKVFSRMSEIRRHAESMIVRETPKSKLTQEQERQRQASAAKTERLRKLRLSKEAAERDIEGPKPVRQQKRRPRRTKRY